MREASTSVRNQVWEVIPRVGRLTDKQIAKHPWDEIDRRIDSPVWERVRPTMIRIKLCLKDMYDE
jgi:hypothetical protein